MKTKTLVAFLLLPLFVVAQEVPIECIDIIHFDTSSSFFVNVDENFYTEISLEYSKNYGITVCDSDSECAGIVFEPKIGFNGDYHYSTITPIIIRGNDFEWNGTFRKLLQILKDESTNSLH